MGLIIIMLIMVIMVAYCLQPYYAYKKELATKAALDANGQKK